MEAMAAGLPCVVSKIRCNVDLIDSNGGFLCNPNDSQKFADATIICTEERIKQIVGSTPKN